MAIKQLLGLDGYLYIALGGGGSACNFSGNGQNLSTLLGSILRNDVNLPSDFARAQLTVAFHQVLFDLVNQMICIGERF